MKDITRGNLSKNFILYAIPVIISGVLNQAYLTVDKIMVGQILGEVGLAALGSTGSFITLMKSLIWGLGTGVSLYVAFLSTCSDRKRLVNAIKVNLITIAGLALAVSVLSTTLYVPIFKMLAINNEIWHDSFVYYAVTMSGFVFFTFGNAASYIFNALGNPSFPMVLAIVSSFGNIIFNYIFIIPLGLGVFGAAFASVLVALVTSLIYIIKLRCEFASLGCAGEKIRFKASDIRPAWRQGVPCMIQQFVMYVSGAAVQPAVNLIGTSAIAAYSVCSEIYSINSTIFQNSSRGLSPFCAQCYGKGEYALVRRGVKVSLRQGILLSVPIMAMFLIFHSYVPDLFMSEPTKEASDYVVLYVLLCVPFVVFQIINNLFHNFYRGVMRPGLAMTTTVVYTLLRIAVTYALVGSLGMLGVFLGFIIPWGAECVLSVLLYLTGRWERSEMKSTLASKTSANQ